ncbi:MAG TPA: hypothetical protein VF337_03500 [Candidatus Limnocylindrales bacterium]
MTLVVTLAFLVASSALVTVALPMAPACLHFSPGFDAQIWASTSICNARFSMVDDLIAHHLPVGMTRDEVVALLGQPATPYEGGTDQGDRTLEYDMGGWMDTNWLVIQFDEDWLLTKAFWYQG